MRPGRGAGGGAAHPARERVPRVPRCTHDDARQRQAGWTLRDTVHARGGRRHSAVGRRGAPRGGGAAGPRTSGSPSPRGFRPRPPAGPAQPRTGAHAPVGPVERHPDPSFNPKPWQTTQNRPPPCRPGSAWPACQAARPSRPRHSRQCPEPWFLGTCTCPPSGRLGLARPARPSGPHHNLHCPEPCGLEECPPPR